MQKPRFSLRFKMVLFMVTTLLAVTGSVSWLSSQPFIEQNKNLIFELNSTASTKMANSLYEFFKSNSTRLAQLGGTLFQQTSLPPDSEFIFLSLYSRNSQDEFGEEKKIAHPDFQGLFDPNGVTKWKVNLEKAGRGQPQIFPVKLSRRGWTLALAVPYLSENQEITGRVLAGLIRPELISDLLGESEPSQVLLVSSAGILLAASADCPFENGTDVTVRPSVQAFLSRKFDNGQSRVQDPDTQRPILSGFRTVGFNDLGIITEVTEAMAFTAVRRVQYRTLLVAVLIFSVAFIFGHFESESITQPIADLAQAAGEIAQGNFQVPISVRASNELGMLAAAFTRMKKELHTRELALLNQEKLATAGRIARNIGHEFGNLLQPLIVKLDLLERSLQKEGNPVAGKAVEDILQIATLGSEICRGLMTLSRERPDAVNFGPVALVGTVKKAIGLLSHELKAKDVVPKVEVPEDLVVSAAEPQILQVLINLLINALHAMGPGGQLSIRGSQKGDKIRLEVRDNGTGIKPEDLQRMFEPLFSTKGAQGNGLGLGIARTILSSHNGGIYAESIYGEGTTMILEFPRPDDLIANAA